MWPAAGLESGVVQGFPSAVYGRNNDDISLISLCHHYRQMCLRSKTQSWIGNSVTIRMARTRNVYIKTMDFPFAFGARIGRFRLLCSTLFKSAIADSSAVTTTLMHHIIVITTKRWCKKACSYNWVTTSLSMHQPCIGWCIMHDALYNAPSSSHPLISSNTMHHPFHASSLSIMMHHFCSCTTVNTVRLLI
jgi:hypothetical protein